MLKQKHDTILTNYILRPTIKRFTEGKYYSKSSWLGKDVFRVDKITKCFITIHYAKYFGEEESEWVEIRMKRRYDKDDYEYFDGRIEYKTKDVIELDKNPIVGRILWNEFDWSRESFGIFGEYGCERNLNNLMFNPKETNGDIEWLLIDLRKKKIVEYDEKIVEALQDSNRYTAERYIHYASRLNDVNILQIALYGKSPPPTQSETK
tara:strand:- start:761 stop:1381 length:621 start_codon:yes stop_codon:yes gene_type:complete